MINQDDILTCGLCRCDLIDCECDDWDYMDSDYDLVAGEYEDQEWFEGYAYDPEYDSDLE